MKELSNLHRTEKFEQNSGVEYMIFHTLEETPFYRNLSRWPLHITIVPPFQLNLPDARKALGSLLWDTTDDHQQFLVTPSTSCGFGPNHEWQATKIVDHVGKLQALHEQLIRGIGALGCENMDEQWSLRNYQPHVADVDGVSLSSEPILIDSISLMSRSENTKRLIARVGLSK